MARHLVEDNDRRQCRLQPFYLGTLLLLALTVFHVPWVDSKEVIVFEKIGELAGVTAYVDVHIELSIFPVEQQLSKYRKLLLTTLGTEVSIFQCLMGQDDPTVYKEQMGSSTSKSAIDASMPWAIKANAKLWKKVVNLHLCDMDDIDHHISSLRNALPRLPNCNKDQIHVKLPYTEPPISNNKQHLIHPYPDMLDHLLYLADRPRRPTSRGLNPYDLYRDDLLESATSARSPTTPRPTFTKEGSAFKPKLHRRCKKSADLDPRLQSQPLT